jgi:prophage regulatory protein
MKSTPKTVDDCVAHMLATTEEAHEKCAAVGAEDRLIREEECARLSGVSRSTRWRLERRGRFPRRRQISENATGWLLSEVLSWLRSRAPKEAGSMAPAGYTKSKNGPAEATKTKRVGNGPARCPSRR